RGINDNGMEAKAARAGMPLGPSGMRGEGRDFVPSLAAVLATEERRGGDTGVEDLRLAGPARFDMPDALQLQPRTFRKSGILLRRRPTLAEISGPNQFAPEPGVIGGGVNAPAARVIDGVIDFAAILERALQGPAAAIGAGERKQSFFRAGKKQSFHGCREINMANTRMIA